MSPCNYVVITITLQCNYKVTIQKQQIYKDWWEIVERLWELLWNYYGEWWVIVERAMSSGLSADDYHRQSLLTSVACFGRRVVSAPRFRVTALRWFSVVSWRWRYWMWTDECSVKWGFSKRTSVFRTKVFYLVLNREVRLLNPHLT